MKKRSLFLIATVLLACCAYFLLPDCRPTLYDDHFVSGELTVQAGFSEDRTEVLYTVLNHTDRDIVYDFVVLECQTDDGWQEVLDRAFQRQTALGYEAVGLYFPAGESIQGSLSLSHLRAVNASAYRLVFPFSDTSVVVFSSPFS